jgi:hypothetical protein
MEIDEIDVSSTTREERAGLYEKMRRVNCMTRISETETRGITAEFLADKLTALVNNEPYGEPGGTMRRILSVFVMRNTSVLTRAGNPVAAFALVCAAAPADTEHRFHRLKDEHVDRSVFLALLCGTGATEIMNVVVKKYVRDMGLVITMDCLRHVIPYYLRPEFGVARMIDTELAFQKSGAVQKSYKRAFTKAAKQKVRASALKLEPEIRKGEDFTPLAECAFRGRTTEDISYVQAHIVILPLDLEASAFEDLCKTTPSLPSRLSPRRKAPKKR